MVLTVVWCSINYDYSDKYIMQHTEWAVNSRSHLVSKVLCSFSDIIILSQCSHLDRVSAVLGLHWDGVQGSQTEEGGEKKCQTQWNLWGNINCEKWSCFYLHFFFEGQRFRRYW